MKTSLLLLISLSPLSALADYNCKCEYDEIHLVAQDDGSINNQVAFSTGSGIIPPGLLAGKYTAFEQVDHFESNVDKFVTANYGTNLQTSTLSLDVPSILPTMIPAELTLVLDSPTKGKRTVFKRTLICERIRKL